MITGSLPSAQKLQHKNEVLVPRGVYLHVILGFKVYGRLQPAYLTHVNLPISGRILVKIGNTHSVNNSVFSILGTCVTHYGNSMVQNALSELQVYNHTPFTVVIKLVFELRIATRTGEKPFPPDFNKK